MKIRRYAGVLAGATAMTLLAACGGAAVNGSAGKSEEDGPIRIAVVSAKSGSFAPLGELQRNGIDFAAKEANANGGIDGRKVEVFHADNRSTPEGSVQAAQRLVQQKKARFIIGTVASPNTLAVVQRLDKLDALQIGTQSQMDDLTGAQCNARFFRSNMSDAMSFNGLGAWLEQSGIQDFDAIHPDYSFGEASAVALKDAMGEVGGTVDVTLMAPLGTSDYAPFIRKLDGGEALMVSVAGTDAVNFFKQAFEFGLFDKYETVVANGGVLTSSAFKAIADERLEGFYGLSNWTPMVDTEQSKAFVKAYTESEGEPPSDGAGYAYIGMQTLFAGIEKAGSVEPEDVARALEGLTYETLKGEVVMRGEDHQAAQSVYVGRVVKTDYGLDLAIEDEFTSDQVLAEPSAACKL